MSLTISKAVSAVENPLMEVTNLERKIILIIRENKPFEEVRIVKDKDGKMRDDKVLVIRSQKLIITDEPDLTTR